MEIALSLRRRSLVTAALWMVVVHTAAAQTLAGDAVVAALRKGGYAIVMRHASSPRQTPTKESAAPGNDALERQLDDAGRASAAAMGKALATLKVPIREIVSSPTFRARETAKHAGWTTVTTHDELGDGGQSMAPVGDAQGGWLLKKVAAVAPGSNLLVITHAPNLTRAFGQMASGLADGEALIVSPDGKGGATVVARVKIEDWPKFR
jgi:phosphohistidine phosphatase SixA